MSSRYYARNIYDYQTTRAGDKGTYTVTFPYIDKGHVKVFADGKEVNITNWTSDNSIQIQLTKKATPKRIEVRRVTPNRTSFVKFYDNAILKASDLNLAHTQLLYLYEECADELVKTESLVNEQNSSIDEVYSKVYNVTKKIQSIEQTLNDRIDGVVSKLNSEIADVRQDIKRDQQNLSSDIYKKLANLRKDITTKYQKLESSLRLALKETDKRLSYRIDELTREYVKRTNAIDDKIDLHIQAYRKHLKDTEAYKAEIEAYKAKVKQTEEEHMKAILLNALNIVTLYNNSLIDRARLDEDFIRQWKYAEHITKNDWSNRKTLKRLIKLYWRVDRHRELVKDNTRLLNELIPRIERIEKHDIQQDFRLKKHERAIAILTQQNRDLREGLLELKEALLDLTDTNTPVTPQDPLYDALDANGEGIDQYIVDELAELMIDTII